jgi:NAD(P)-dependent dehydrogenase (short-subunit alcohol dehydrogenase family)
VTVNVVAPGFIDTDMTRALEEKQVQALRERIPLARLGSVADVAAAVVFLVSDAGGYITGETLNVNWRDADALKKPPETIDGAEIRDIRADPARRAAR